MWHRLLVPPQFSLTSLYRRTVPTYSILIEQAQQGTISLLALYVVVHLLDALFLLLFSTLAVRVVRLIQPSGSIVLFLCFWLAYALAFFLLGIANVKMRANGVGVTFHGIPRTRLKEG